VIDRIGILGAGHLAGYLVEGFHRKCPAARILLADRERERVERMAQRWQACIAKSNQALVDASDLLILAVRPGDALEACDPLAFREHQIVASAVAGLGLDLLQPKVAPAKAVRVMPISSAALNQSPTLLFPDDPRAREVFSLLGSVLAVRDEATFTTASVLAAFYGWMYALAMETIAWAERSGISPGIARQLVLETIRSSADMALADPATSMQEMLERLATPGGMTEQGLRIIHERQGLEAWTAALEGVLCGMKAPREER
jgi:pyrroline-5-carboxylate reductase